MKEASSIYYPPGPVHKLPLSLFLNFLRNPIEVLNNISKYGDISHFNGTQLVYFLNRPDYIRDVLVTYNNNFIKSRGVQLAKKVLGDGLLTSEGNIHRKQRQLIQPSFHQDRLKIYAAIMTEYILRISNSWKDNNVLDIHEEFMQLMLFVRLYSALISNQKLVRLRSMSQRLSSILTVRGYLWLKSLKSLLYQAIDVFVTLKNN